jgi:hypothetical protein
LRVSYCYIQSSTMNGENGQSLQVYFMNQFSRLDKNGGARGIDKILHRLRARAY